MSELELVFDLPQFITMEKKKTMEFQIINNTNREFKQLEGESARVYVYENNVRLTIDNPVYTS